MLKTLAIVVHQFKQWIVVHLPFLIPRSRGGIHHMVLSVVLMALALMVRFSIAPVDAGLQYVVFFPAVSDIICMVFRNIRVPKAQFA